MLVYYSCLEYIPLNFLLSKAPLFKYWKSASTQSISSSLSLGIFEVLGHSYV